MLPAASQYSDFRREYDELLQHAIAVLEAQAGHRVQNERENYGEKLFGKIVCHAISLQRLMPDPKPASDNEIWDISSAYAVSRAILESYEALAYIAGENIADLELECRIILWKLHAEERRLKMLNLIGSKNPAIKDVENTIQNLRDALLEPRFQVHISSEVRRRIEKRDSPPYLHSRKARLSAVKVNADYFTAALMQLSQHVHAYPFSLHQLFEFKAGTADAYMLMKVGGQYACGYLSAAVRDMSGLFSPRLPRPSENVRRTLDLWCGVLERGVRMT